ncbi:hypothetical protein ACH4VS_06880 [Streptomyces hygroscopicus]|uniref:hypothetical protein n=1 Tax=Streptomyces hygroscopicus TaxID=1912 RepID=UPI000A70D372|nr:hypothetical protein [Streptomyces hygroscopicus]
MTSLDTLAEPVHIGGKLPEVAYDTIALADMNADGKTDINGDGRPDLLGLRKDGTLVAHAHSGAFDPANPTAVLREPVVVAKGWHDVTASADPAISRPRDQLRGDDTARCRLPFCVPVRVASSSVWAP